MPEFLKIFFTGAIGLFTIVSLALLYLWLRDRIEGYLWRRANPPEKQAADRLAFEQRLLHPDWAFYERHLERPAPTALRELFDNAQFITAQCLETTDADDVNTFGPLDTQGLIDTQEWIGFDIVPIATSSFGDPIYLRPGPTEPDTVYITIHDGGYTEVFAESVAKMVEELRKANNLPHPA